MCLRHIINKEAQFRFNYWFNNIRHTINRDSGVIIFSTNFQKNMTKLPKTTLSNIRISKKCLSLNVPHNFWSSFNNINCLLKIRIFCCSKQEPTLMDCCVITNSRLSCFNNYSYSDVFIISSIDLKQADSFRIEMISVTLPSFYNLIS